MSEKIPVQPEMSDWHILDANEVLDALTVDPRSGLNAEEHATRLAYFGGNELESGPSRFPLGFILRELIEPSTLLLTAAAIGLFALDDAFVGGVVLIAAALGVVMNVTKGYRRGDAMAALKRIVPAWARVRRDGREQRVPAVSLVPGDVILLEAGEAVPADARLIETVNLRVEEVALTGETHLVEKVPQPVRDAAVLPGERHNMVYLGTSILSGRGTAVVVATGMRTELGRIARRIGADEPGSRSTSPLQKAIAGWKRRLVIAALAAALLAILAGYLRGISSSSIFQIVLSIFVATVPESLPVLMTLALVSAARRIRRRKVLVRRLQAVETLASVTSICTDKTAVIDQNSFRATLVDASGHRLSLDGTLERGRPVLNSNEQRLETPYATHRILLAGCALCNDALLDRRIDGSGDYTTIGDPSEAALLISAARLGLYQPRLERLFPRLGGIPFSYERERMSTIHAARLTPHLDEVEKPVAELFHARQPFIAFARGSYPALLDASAFVRVDEKVVRLDNAWRARLREYEQELMEQGQRVLAVAYRPLATLPAPFEEPPEELSGLSRTTADTRHSEEFASVLETNLILLGLVGLMDLPRPEVIDAIRACQGAGIRPVMITSDHPFTAERIARQLNLLDWSREGRGMLTGKEMEKLTALELERMVEGVTVYARIFPEHRISILEALQRRGHVVAMTGERIADAPALQRSDLGIALANAGTPVSKEAAGMVLLEDNFAAITAAVEESRRAFGKIHRAIAYTLANAMGALLTVLAALALGMPEPLNVLQLLWLNLIITGLPGLALAWGPGERDSLSRPPVRAVETLVGRSSRAALRRGVAMGLAAAGLGWWAWMTGKADWAAMTLAALSFAQAGHALTLLPRHREPDTKSWILPASVLSVLLQWSALYWAPLRGMLRLAPLSPIDLLISALAAIAFILWAWLERSFSKKDEPING